MLGVNALDYSGYPDCRPEYLAAFEQLAALATRAGVEGQPLEILAPLLELSKAEIIRQGLALGCTTSSPTVVTIPIPPARRAARATAAGCARVASPRPASPTR